MTDIRDFMVGYSLIGLYIRASRFDPKSGHRATSQKWSGPWYGAVRRWSKGKLLNQRRLVLSGMHGHAMKQAKWYLRPATGPGQARAHPAPGGLWKRGRAPAQTTR